jgi:hypothetical protein
MFISASLYTLSDGEIKAEPAQRVKGLTCLPRRLVTA